MSVARGNGQNGGHYYSNITQPVKLDWDFIVDSANGNGLGVRSVKSNGYVRNVFMHTSASPGINNGYTNPNPNAGFALIQFNNNYKVYLGGFEGNVAPTSGGTSNSTTAGVPAIIATLGTTTLAQWQAAGLPPGLVPTVGQSFSPIATGAMGGTGTVIGAGVSPIVKVEVIGNPNASIATSSIAIYGGAWLMVQFLAATNAGTTTLIPTAPADGIPVGMSAFFDISSVTIDGL